MIINFRRKFYGYACKDERTLGFDNFEEEYEDDVEVIGEDSRMDLEHTRHEDYSYDIKQELKKLEEEK